MRRLLPSLCLVLSLLPLLADTPVSTSSADPLADFKQEWTTKLPWSKVVNINDIKGESLDERVQKAQADLVSKGGGVIFFPAGSYSFKENLVLESGIILRGETPKIRDARKEEFGSADNLRSRLDFPKYVAKNSGEGSPISSAFKGIVLREPGTASNVGVVHLAINRGHIHFGDDKSEKHFAGKNRFVVGCLLTNAAVADPAIPDVKLEQHPWQRFTARHHAAVEVKGENLLIAANRLPESGEENFTMKGYVVRQGKNKVTLEEVVFDYDNRPGLYVNDYGLGGGGASDPNGTPESHPWGFRKGIVIRDNYLFQTGRCAIAFAGDGVLCKGNLIRFKKDVYRPTATGRDKTGGASTNDNRAVQMRGWRWIVEENDYIIHRNMSADRKYYINDGEGLMHEDHVNSTVKESKLLRNKGNTYLSIYKTAGIDGLLVQGNEIHDGIMVVADRNKSRHECKNVQILDNITHGPITIGGEPASNNVIKNNINKAMKEMKLVNRANATLEANKGFFLAEK